MKFDVMEADRGAQSTSSPAGHWVAPADSSQAPCEPRTAARNTRAHARSYRHLTFQLRPIGVSTFLRVVVRWGVFSTRMFTSKIVTPVNAEKPGIPSNRLGATRGGRRSVGSAASTIDPWPQSDRCRRRPLLRGIGPPALHRCRGSRVRKSRSRAGPVFRRAVPGRHDRMAPGGRARKLTNIECVSSSKLSGSAAPGRGFVVRAEAPDAHLRPGG